MDREVDRDWLLETIAEALWLLRRIDALIFLTPVRRCLAEAGHPIPTLETMLPVVLDEITKDREGLCDKLELLAQCRPKRLRS